jgi:Cellulase (glycosyl hydrolase family 5)
MRKSCPQQLHSKSNRKRRYATKPVPLAPLRALSPWTFEWETFHVIKQMGGSSGDQIRPGDSVSLRDITGGYVCSVISWPYSPLHAGAPWAREWETFTIATIPNINRVTGLGNAQRKGYMLPTYGNPDSKAIITGQNLIETLAANGVTLVRFPIYFSANSSPNSWINYAQAVYDECQKYKISMVIEIHHPSSVFDNGSKIENIGLFVRTWERIAGHFKGKQGLWYELLNEPRGYTLATVTEDKLRYGNNAKVSWYEVAQRTANAIRTVEKMPK